MARDMNSHAGLTQPRTLFQQQLERLCSKNCVDAVKEAFGENFMSKQVSVGALRWEHSRVQTRHDPIPDKAINH